MLGEHTGSLGAGTPKAGLDSLGTLMGDCWEAAVTAQLSRSLKALAGVYVC